MVLQGFLSKHQLHWNNRYPHLSFRRVVRWSFIYISVKRLIRVLNLQQNLQQFGTFGLLLRYCCDSAIIISLYLTIINVFSARPYKPEISISNPLLIKMPYGTCFLKDMMCVTRQKVTTVLQPIDTISTNSDDSYHSLSAWIGVCYRKKWFLQ